MPDSIVIGRNVQSFESAPEFDGYSKVVLIVSDELSYEAGTDTGRVLELECPWGSQSMANNILASIRGWQYQPYSAEKAFVDPSAELGDGVTVNGLYSGIYAQSLSLDGLCVSDIKAPSDEEIDHEIPFESKGDRKITRKFAQMESELKVQASEISAKVSQTGGNAQQTFGWSLTSDGFVISSNGSTVFEADKDGIAVTGKIKATSGFIGSEAYGFEIDSNSIRNNMKSLYDTENGVGVYIGTDGIALGGGNFRVDSSGNLSAQSATINGSLVGSFSGGGASFGGGGGARLPSSFTVGGTAFPTAVENIVVQSLVADRIAASMTTSTNMKCGTLSGTVLQGNYVKFNWGGWKTLSARSITYKDANDNAQSLNVVTWY